VCRNNFRIAQLAHRLENGEFTRATVTFVAAEQDSVADSKSLWSWACRFSTSSPAISCWQYDQPSSSRR